MIDMEALVKKPTLVIGASEKIDRYANMAVRRLKLFGQPVIALGNKEGFIDDIPIHKVRPYLDQIHTITLYINAIIQRDYYDYILTLAPQRVIFNPGTENPEFYSLLENAGIKWEEACTLVLLNIGQY